MKAVILFGDYAVGKKTIATYLCAITGFRFYEYPLRYDVLNNLFGKKTKMIATQLEETVLGTLCAQEERGLVIPALWCFDQPNGGVQVQSFETFFTNAGVEVCFAELTAEYETLLQRNRDRLAQEMHDDSIDLETSERDYFWHTDAFRYTSFPEDVQGKRYFRLDTTNLSPEEAADHIREAFRL